MNHMQFIIELADKLAWPLVALVALVMLKRPLEDLLPLAKRLKYKDLEVEFGQVLQAVSRDAAGVFPELEQDRRSRLIATVKHLPNAAVLEAWDEVDNAAETLIRQQVSEVDLAVDTRYKTMGTILARQALLDTKKVKLFHELRQLRNKVAHAENFTVGPAEAVQYIELCLKLVDHLNAVHPTDSNADSPSQIRSA
ncbi:hypothetical protein [Aliamphritea spongicola]|uniref:hypothetical protein n=1 Tax=Aliamphritea spongicola TaxID=707589 RepID=UPI00196B27E8|nr:hypothetical protein [Aliamphritea spongicola]MBN3562236.1 hypothetical protein [Aliamphritea spongicola]